MVASRAKTRRAWPAGSVFLALATKASIMAPEEAGAGGRASPDEMAFFLSGMAAFPPVMWAGTRSDAIAPWCAGERPVGWRTVASVVKRPRLGAPCFVPGLDEAAAHAGVAQAAAQVSEGALADF